MNKGPQNYQKEFVFCSTLFVPYDLKIWSFNCFQKSSPNRYECQSIFPKTKPMLYANLWNAQAELPIFSLG